MKEKDLKNFYNEDKIIKDLLSKCQYIKEVTPELENSKLKREYKKTLNKLGKMQEKQNKIMDQINKLEDSTYKRILYNIYILGMSLEQCSAEMNYDYYVLTKKKRSAIKEFEQIERGQKKTKKDKDFKLKNKYNNNIKRNCDRT